jgi:hypothetical protein
LPFASSVLVAAERATIGEAVAVQVSIVES